MLQEAPTPPPGEDPSRALATPSSPLQLGARPKVASVARSGARHARRQQLLAVGPVQAVRQAGPVLQPAAQAAIGAELEHSGHAAMPLAAGFAGAAPSPAFAQSWHFHIYGADGATLVDMARAFAAGMTPARRALGRP